MNPLKRFILPILISSLCFAFLPRIISSSINETGIIITLLGLLSGLIASLAGIYILFKEKRSNQILSKARKRDLFWDEQEMKVNARMVFYKIQDAFEKSDPTIIKNFTTPEFYSFFESGLKKSRPSQNESQGSYGISETRIICCQDFLNNENDMYVAYIKAYLGSNNSEEEFSEVYYFKRFNDSWLLHKINNGLGILNLVFVSNKEEN